MKTALIVIDVQNYFLKKTPKSLPSEIAKQAVNHSYDLVLFTVFKNKDNSNFTKSLSWDECKSGDDIKLASELQTLVTMGSIFTKSTYSAMKATDLNEYLQTNNIGRLDLCGMDTDGCVLATAFDAFDCGYEVNVLFDLSYSSAGLDESAKKIILRNIQKTSTKVGLKG